MKVLFNPSGENVRLRIFTKEGEKILDVTQKGLYYPRANISSEKMLTNTFSHEGDHKDYYYFKDGLLFNITESESFEGIIIDELVLMYLDIRQPRVLPNPMIPLILKEVTRQSDGRG